MDVQTVIRQIAQQEGISEAEVRQSMEEAMQAGMANPAPEIQAYWRSVPRKGDILTLDEWLMFVAEQIREAKD